MAYIFGTATDGGRVNRQVWSCGKRRSLTYAFFARQCSNFQSLYFVQLLHF